MCRKIAKIVATRCHILRLKCTKFDFGCGSASDPAGGALQTHCWIYWILLPRRGNGRGRGGEGDGLNTPLSKEKTTSYGATVYLMTWL